jgi:hypothetical protein
MAQVVENLPSKHKTLNSLPISAKKEGREEERKEGREEERKGGREEKAYSKV